MVHVHESRDIKSHMNEVFTHRIVRGRPKCDFSRLGQTILELTFENVYLGLDLIRRQRGELAW